MTVATSAATRPPDPYTTLLDATFSKCVFVHHSSVSSVATSSAPTAEFGASLLSANDIEPAARRAHRGPLRRPPHDPDDRLWRGHRRGIDAALPNHAGGRSRLSDREDSAAEGRHEPINECRRSGKVKLHGLATLWGRLSLDGTEGADVAEHLAIRRGHLLHVAFDLGHVDTDILMSVVDRDGSCHRSPPDVVAR